jgi:hypothetical protein
MVLIKDVVRLTPAQEALLLNVEKSIKATHFHEAADQRRFLDQQAKILVRASVFSLRGVESTIF